MKHLHFTRWLLLGLMLVLGNASLSAQIDTTVFSTCNCTDDGLRPNTNWVVTQQVKDSIIFMSSDTVYIDSYLPFEEVDSVLYLEPNNGISDNYYLNGDLSSIARDTLEALGGGLYKFISYRNVNVPFSAVVFRNTDGNSITLSLPVCGATVNDAIVATPGDTICLGDTTMMFTLPGLIGQISNPNITWDIAYGNAMTGSSSPVPMTGSMTTSFNPSFFAPGGYTISVDGRTDSNCPIMSQLPVYVINDSYPITGFDFACAGDMVPFSITSDADLGLYDTLFWNVAGPTPGSSFVGDSTDVDNVVIQLDSVGTYTVMVTGQKNTGTMCTFMETFMVTVASQIDAGITGDTVVCINEIRTFTSNILNLDTVRWSSATGNVLGSSQLDSVTIHFNTAGIDTIIASGSTTNGCIVLDTFYVDVKDSQILLSGNQNVCLGDTSGYRAMYTDASIAEFTTITYQVIPMNPNNTTEVDTAVSPNDSLTVMWGAIGDYMILIDGITTLGCSLTDTFLVNVQDTNHIILGPTLVCVGDPTTFNLVQQTDSSDVSGTSISWTVIRHKPGTTDVQVTETDLDSNSTFVHTFGTSTIIDGDLSYIVIAEGISANGCEIRDTFSLKTIGNQDLDINGPTALCAGGIAQFDFNLSDTLQTGPLSWSAFQKSNNAPLIPSAIDQSRGDTVTIDFPNVADTIIVQVTGTAGPACMFTVQHEVVITDTLSIINSAGLDTLCLTPDSTWYAVNIDTADLNLTTVTWSITSNNGGGAIFPAMTGSGTNGFLSVAYVYPGPGIYTHRVRGMQEVTGCEFDEILTVTVKDTTYFIEGDKQICLGDTTEYALLDAMMMPLPDFPMGDSVSWFVGANQIANGAVLAGSVPSLGYSFAEFSGPIQDTLRIVWAVGGEHVISVQDSTLCCPISVSDTVLVRDNDFMLAGDLSVCMGDTTGYKITNFNGSDVDDLVGDSTQWTVLRGSVLNASTDSITVHWDITGDYINTTDTIIFSGYTNDGCAVHDTIVVGIRSLDFVIVGDANVCQGDSIDLRLVNGVDSSAVADIDSLYWVFSSGNDTIKLDSSLLDVYVDSDSMVQHTWTEQGTYTVSAIGFTNGTCRVNSQFIVVVNENPNPEIMGDLNTCVNSTDVFSVDIDMTNVASISWSVIGHIGTPIDGGTIVSGQNTTDIVVSWASTGGYRITVSGVTTGGCAFTDLVDVGVTGTASIGQLACNNDINVTLPDNCELMLTPDQILQDRLPDIPDEDYEITVENAATGQVLSNGLVDASLLGIQLKVVITHECSGQTCWGYITLEDKTVPDLVCSNDTIPCTSSIDPEVLGYPVPGATSVTQTSANPPIYDVVGFEKCGVAQLTYNDRTSTEVCIGDYGTIIYRDWKLTNQAGLMSTCTDTILIERIDIDSIDLTMLPDFIGDDGFECHLVTRADLQPGTLTGNLSVVSSAFCFNVQATFSDVESTFCGESSYRITRTWTILDWCTGRVRTHVQTIDVLDRMGPEITLATGDINISATDHACSGVYDLTPDITIRDLCSDPVAATVRIFENDAAGALLYTITDGDYSGLAFDPDVTRIFIDVEATDACGRSSQSSTARNINITDNVKPIPICDESTTISLNPIPDEPGKGWAIADWHAFDDGSLDNCGIEKIEIRRMTDNCGIPENLVFGEYVKFCCEDAMLGEEILVQLRVTDVNGNTNECMVMVTVQDNSAISKVVREGDTAISCKDDVTPYLTDDGNTVAFLTTTCGRRMVPDFFTAVVDTTDCGSGTITRNWLITDELGNTLTHTQTITRGLPGETFDPADLVNIWPPDYTGEGCAGPNTSPDALPEAYRPNIDLNGYACSSLGLDYEDLIFRDVEGYCAKVLRTWTLYDWCQRDPFDANSGRWEYVQILRLTDTVAPVIITGCETETFAANSTNSCSATVNTSATADDCHATDDLLWAYTIEDFNGTTVLAGNSNTISTILEVGIYTVSWTATDPCGNTGSCTKELQVFDTSEPNAVFRDITRVITADGITVNGDEVVLRATDNCSDVGNITYHFNTVDGPTSLNFDCASMLGMDFRTLHPDVYVVDESGNAYKGHVNITLEDIGDACDNTTGGEGMIAGQVFTERDFTIDDVEVTLTGMNTGASAFMMTPVRGEFAFENVAMDETYEISASRDDEYLNGVSTLDLLLIQRHILGLTRLDSPYKVIAADIDGSDHISAIDLVHLRRVILGLSSDFPVGKSWTFVDAAQTFENNLRPFPYTDKHTIESLSQDLTDMDFVGVKVGDVNGNVQLQSTLLGITRSIAPVTVGEISRSADEVTLGLTPNTTEAIAGLQLSMGLNEGTEVISVYSDQVDITKDNYTVIDGELRISWTSAKSSALLAEGALFNVTLAAAGEIEDMISLTGEYLVSEIYTEANGDIEVSDVFLEYEAAVGEGMIVEQNVPNPFNGISTIRFYQPTQGDVAFTITDLSGRQLKQKTNKYNKGWHEIEVSTDDLPGSGIYIYEMSNGTELIRKKMITID